MRSLCLFLEANPDIYYLLDSTRFESFHTRLRWGIYHWIDMELAFKQWRASESMSDLFFYGGIHAHVLWDIWSPTLLQLKLPVEMLKHIRCRF